MKTPEEIKKMLDFDPLAHAEKITGKDWQESKETGMLGLAIALQHNREKENALQEIGDTTFSNNVESYLKIVQAFGFEIVFEEAFFDNKHYQRNEKLYALFHKELGILLTFDTFGGSVNSGKMHYNWSPNDKYNSNGCTSSGHFYFPESGGHIGLIDGNGKDYRIAEFPKDSQWDMLTETYEEFKELRKPIDQEQERLLNEAFTEGYRAVWIGDHDCREALISNIKRMQQHGQFLPNWIQQPSCLWICHFAEELRDWRKYDEVSKERIAKFPEYVRKQILA